MNGKFLKLSEEKKENILQAAISEFAEEGYDRASTDNIVVKAKISKGSLFNYFINKQGLYEDVVNYIIAKAQKEVVERLTEIDEGDFYSRLKKVLIIKYSYMMKHPLEAKVLKDYINTNSTKDNKTVKQYRVVEQEQLQRHLITYLNIEEIRPGLTVEDVLFVTNTLLQAVLKRQDELANFDKRAGTKEVVEEEIDKYIRLLKYGIYK